LPAAVAAPGRPEAIDFGGRGADEEEPLARAVQDGAGRGRFGRIDRETLRPLHGLQVLGLQRHEVGTVDLGQDLPGADAIPGDGQDALDAARSARREMGQAPGVELEPARRGDLPAEGKGRRLRCADIAGGPRGRRQGDRGFGFMPGFRFVAACVDSLLATAGASDDNEGEQQRPENGSGWIVHGFLR